VSWAKGSGGGTRGRKGKIEGEKVALWFWSVLKARVKGSEGTRRSRRGRRERMEHGERWAATRARRFRTRGGRDEML
jgi:hypothetical protein